MTKKIFTIIAVLGVIAMSTIGCQSVTDDNNTESSNDKTDSDILAAPVVELPANVGVNPFKGKTFERAWEEYSNYLVFSNDGKTIMSGDNYNSKEFVPSAQYEYSVDANKEELSWHAEKMMYDSELLYSFEELAAYIRSGKFLENREAQLRKELDKGEITKDEFDKRLKEIKEELSNEEAVNDALLSLKKRFTAIVRYKYTYDSIKGTLDLYEQFEKSSASFEYREDNRTSSNELILTDVSVNSNYAIIRFNGRIDFYTQSMSDDEIVFYHEDDKNDTFTASYTLTGSGNDTKMQLSFTYGGKEFNPTLDFAPSERHLTEVK